MKLALLTIAILASFSSFAFEVKIPKAGSYIVTVRSPEECTPSSYAITPKMFRNYATQLEVELTPVVDDMVRLAVCTRGFNTAKGLIETFGKTTVIFPDFGRRHVVTLEEIITTEPVI